jgi:hypothetical protein
MTEEEQVAEVIQFCQAHREELKPAEEWLNAIDEDLVDAWFAATRESPLDWRKILFLEWLFRDEKLYENTINLDGFDAREWCDSSERQFAAHAARMRTYGPWRTERHPVFDIVRDALNKSQPGPDSKKTASLHFFIERYCFTDGITVNSKVKTLQQCERKKKLKLPRLAVDWKQGQAKIFYVDDLKDRWSGYQKVMPSLPNLK